MAQRLKLASHTQDKADDVLAEANEFLADPEVDLPMEEIFIDGKS